MNIEQLGPGSEERLRAIRLRALRDAPDAFGTTFEEAIARPLETWRHQLEQFATFVATEEDCDIGLVRGARHDDLSDVAYLLSLWVAPEVRRQGIAGALIDAVVAWGTGAGFRRLILDVAESNTAARALYLRSGFAPNGTRGTLPPPRQHIREVQLERRL